MEVVKTLTNDNNFELKFDNKFLEDLTSKECITILKKLCNCIEKKDAAFFLEVIADSLVSYYGDEEIFDDQDGYIQICKLEVK